MKIPLRLCSKCSKPHGRAGRYCFDCHAAYMREWRKTHLLSEDHRRRDNARSQANVYKKRGKIVPQPCAVCGAGDAELHHPDHELFCVVVWLCRPCHLNWHAHWRDLVRTTFAKWLARAKMRVAA